MNETEEVTEQVEPAAARTADETDWEAPGHTVVETALEVTGYYSESV
ncbi:pyrroloquinoline quinone precursor peptide PqqA [Streptomyces sp. TRM64462]|nr:pyrroloquinoline quinone precursor peptide PqqA [Streptomyces sp. TRM64462]